MFLRAILDIIWVSVREKPVFGGLRTTKVQTSLRIRAVCLISTFVVRLLERIISRLVKSEISIF